MIRFSNSRIPMGRDNRLEVKNLTLNSGELWVIAGPGGSGKSSMARAIAGVPDAAGYHIPVPGLTRRSPHNDKDGGAWVSFDSEREIRDLLRHNDDSEVLGRPDEGTSLDSFIGGRSGKAYLNPKLLKKLNGRGIKNLSTGEFRQVFIAREAGKNPALAVLDEPFEGLDKIARSRLIKQLGEWSESETLIVLTVNRLEDIPIFATGLIFLDGKQMIAMGPPSELLENPTVITLFKRSFPVNVKQTIPAAPENSGFQGDSLIEMKKVSLSFNGRSILENINWIVKPGESWLLTGPNGSGKTTLLNLISGNEPRGFGQNLNLFGRKKGSGETTAEIKGQIGQVSAAMQDSISRNSNPIEIIGSGLRDSMILIEPLDGYEAGLVDKWLVILGLENSRNTAFSKLSYGERRLAMIGRAMIKHPPLLLLDEPMQGLDAPSRSRVKNLIDSLVKNTKTSIVFVSHRNEDAPESISNHLRLVPSKSSGSSRAEISIYP